MVIYKISDEQWPFPGRKVFELPGKSCLKGGKMRGYSTQIEKNEKNENVKQYLVEMLDRNGLGLLEQRAHGMAQFYAMGGIPGKPVVAALLEVDKHNGIAVRMRESAFYQNLSDMCRESKDRIYFQRDRSGLSLNL
jgi:hypothetical protein